MNPIEVAAPWPFAAALLDLRARRRTRILEDLRPVRADKRDVRTRATLLTFGADFPGAFRSLRPGLLD